MSDWERIQEVFLMTADAPAGEQPRLLDSLCSHDPELRAEVESLLASDCDSGTIIAEAVQSEATLLLDVEPLAGKRVGAYRIVREIGRGGMGAVYLATRDDEVFQKRVAVKVVKPGMDTADVLDRFRYERQILASLEHPYIARLFDGGSTDQGLPFFVMEYVEGQPVNLFCRGRTLNNRDRCELFLKILEAVAYAHRNLVVHRDLKPGNIFVTEEGTPKLLDFGVAKLISGNVDGRSTLTTVLRPFTPEYASPEQVLGLAVTTSTDVYSLGAVFYELLTDRRAQPILTPTPSEIERAVCEMEAPRPSQIAPSVDEDLDNIVLMAMRKEPERRYQSVDQFSEDIQRYLDGRPILARQNSLSYRLRKFLLRNRLELATVTVLIVGLSGGLVVSLLQTRRADEALRLAESQRVRAVHENARAAAEAHKSEEALASEARQRAIAEHETSIAEQQRDIAQHETAVAEQRLTDMLELAGRTLFDVHDAVAKLPGSMAARKEIVKTTLEYLEHLESESGLNDEMRIALAAAYYKVSLIQGNFGGPSLQDFPAAQISLEKGKAILLPLYLRKSGDPAVMLRWIEIESGLADLDYHAGNDREAIQRNLALLPVAHRLAQALPNDPVAARQESAIEQALAITYLRTGDSKGLEHADRGVALMRELTARFPSDVDLKQALGSLLAAEAGALKNAGELEKSASLFRQSIQIRDDLLHNNPQDTLTRRNLMVVYGNYSSLLGSPISANLGRPDEARVYGDKAVALARESVASDPQDATARYDLGIALSRLGSIDPPPDKVSESLAHLQESYELVAPIAKANPKSAVNAYELADILYYRSDRLQALGRNTEAIEGYRKAMDVLQPFLGSGNLVVTGENIYCEEGLAQIYASTGDHAAALEIAKQAVANAEKRNAVPPPSEYRTGGLVRAYAILAAVQEKEGEDGQARQSAERAAEIWKQIHNPGVISIHSGIMIDNAKLLARLGAALPSK
jgi:eukaryotic-like serine/threonine-protein kinase